MHLALKIVYPILIVAGLCLINPSNAAGQTMDYLYDPTFTPENIVGGSGGSVNSILVHEDGRYTIAGPFQFNWPLQIKKMVRFYNEGSHDESFSPPGNPITVSVMQFFQDGYLIWVPNTIGPIDESGDYPNTQFLDLSYDPYQPSAPPSPYVAMYQIMEDDKVMVAGRFSPDTTDLEDRRHLVRVHPDGSPDPTFEPLKCHEPLNARINNLYPTTDGKWMITGEFMDIEGFESPCIARLNADFSVDSTFHSPFPDHTWNVYIIPGSHPQKLFGAIDEQNRVYVSRVEPGHAYPLLGLEHVRLLHDGSIDSTFQVNDIYYTSHDDGELYPGSIYTIAFEPDGSLIVGGKFRTIAGQPRGNIAKIDEVGSLVEGVFHRQGADTANWQNGNNPDIDVPHINRIVRLDNGGLMVGGRFSRYDGHDQWGVVRLLPSPVSVEENKGNPELAIYPNPATNVIRLVLEPINQIERIDIYDMSGKRVLANSLQHFNGTVNVSSLPAGMFAVHIKMPGKELTGKFFKK